MNMGLARSTKGYKFFTRRLYSTNVKKWASTNCTSFVPYGTNLGSTINIGRFPKNIQELVYLPYDIYSIIVGTLLSDGWLEK